jgi:hypothetical protein
MQNEFIVECGTEGGSWTLVGSQEASGWKFRVVRDEGTLLDFMDEEGREGFEPWEESIWVEGWEAALVLLDEYPWQVFRPVRVHRDLQGRFGRRCKIAATRIRTSTGCAGRRQGVAVQRL